MILELGRICHVAPSLSLTVATPFFLIPFDGALQEIQVNRTVPIMMLRSLPVRSFGKL